MKDLRLILDPPLSGPLNMAIDEALLESAANDGISTLRLYQWREPTLSLGYFQAANDRQAHQPSLTCPLVRRASGGGAILHDRELTYSLALPEKSSSTAASRLLYELCHSTLIAALQEMGIASTLFSNTAQACEHAQPEKNPPPFLCFQRRTCFDIVASEAKIVGSPQRRRRGAVLQHGSILLSQSPFAPELPGIEQIFRKVVAAAQLTDLWPPQLAGAMDISLSPASPSSAEQNRAKILCHERFAANDWLYRR